MMRKSGPGKFEGEYVIDRAVYDATLEGADEECGESDAGGWYGLVRGGPGDARTSHPCR